MLLYDAWGDIEQCTPEILKFLLSPWKGVFLSEDLSSEVTLQESRDREVPGERL